MYIAEHRSSDRERLKEYASSRLGTEIPGRCSLTPCEDLMLKLCTARNDLRKVTAEKQRKQRELDDAQDKYARLTCSRSKTQATAKKACQILTNRIATLTGEVSNLESERQRLRGQFWSSRDQYVQICGSLPSGFSAGKAVTLRKPGSGGVPCFWRQPC